MHKIVAIWAHPRSRSTALERVFIERGDFEILHEPFSALYYLHEDRAEAVHANFRRQHRADFATIRHRIEQAARARPVCFKDMCYHCHEHLLASGEFLQRLDNVFLIRDPKPSIASHYAKNPNVTLEEIGYEQQARVFRAVAEQAGEAPLVIQAEDFVATPEPLMRRLCQRLGIDHRPEALSWSAGEREEWTEWQAWHDEVANSAGIKATATDYTETVENNPKLAAMYAHHLPFFEELQRHRLRAD